MAADGLAREVVEPDEAEVAQRFIAFLQAVSRKRAAGGPIRRFNQGRASGCVEAELEVRADLSDTLKVGLFAQPRRYRAWIRFANATSASDRDRDLRGMSIKVFDVPGVNLTDGATFQDFILNSHPVMLAPDTREFMGLLEALEAGRLRAALFFARHPRLLRIALAARDHPSSHLALTYWSTTPFLFGEGRAVKYIARPATADLPGKPSALTDTYLRDALAGHLASRDASFDLLVQFQTDPARMPIEDATVEWKEEDSPYLPVARIRIPPQPIDDAARIQACEEVAFNPWHAPLEHRPLGNLNRARRTIYPALAAFRAAGGARPAPA